MGGERGEREREGWEGRGGGENERDGRGGREGGREGREGGEGIKGMKEGERYWLSHILHVQHVFRHCDGFANTDHFAKM